MKIIISLFILCLCLCVSAQTKLSSNPVTTVIAFGVTTTVATAGSGGGGCTTIFDQNTSSQTDVDAIGQDSGSVYGGQYSYVPLSNASICGVQEKLTVAAGDISGKTYTAFIYNATGTGNSFTPGSPIGTSDTINGNNSWLHTAVKFSFGTPVSITTAGTYVIVVKCNQSPDNLNFINFDLSDGGGLAGFTGTWDSTGTLQSGFTTKDTIMTLYTP